MKQTNKRLQEAQAESQRLQLLGESSSGSERNRLMVKLRGSQVQVKEEIDKLESTLKIHTSRSSPEQHQELSECRQTLQKAKDELQTLSSSMDKGKGRSSPVPSFAGSPAPPGSQSSASASSASVPDIAPSISDRDLLRLQKEKQQRQLEPALNTIEKSLAETKVTATATRDEIVLQRRLLEEANQNADAVQGRLTAAQRLLHRVNLRNQNCKLWAVIITLLAVLLLVLVEVLLH